MENTILEEIKKGARFKTECLDLNHEGQGVCKISGLKENEPFYNFPLFVDNFLPSEKGIIEITKLAKDYGYAKVITFFKETKKAEHIHPICPNYWSCGGCNLMHMNYEYQLKFKRQMVEDTIKKIGGLDDIKVLPVIGMKKPYDYRNKVQVPFRKKGPKTISGFFKRNSHEIIPFDKCYIQPDVSTEVSNFVRNLCNEYKITGYNEIEHSGLIRHVLVRTNFELSQVMIVLVLTNATLPHQEEIVEKISKRYPTVQSIVINVNNQKGNTILGNVNITIYGNDTISDTLLGKKFNIGVQSFYQVNHQQTEILYSKAIEIADLNKEDILIDAYCGIGTIGLIASNYVKEVYSVEIVKEAVQNALKNAKQNKVKNIYFVCEKAEVQIKKWLNEGIKPTVIVVDPPRKGCDKTLLDTIDEMNIQKIVYVSCDPATLARDLKYLTEKNYQVLSVQPVDMFPQTSNVECITYLKRK